MVRYDMGGVVVEFLAQLTRFLYRMARLTNDLQALSTGDPRRILRHWTNKWIGRTVGRKLYWRAR